MLFLFIFCILNFVVLIVAFRKINSLTTGICTYVATQYPELWQHFLMRGRLMGDEKKWAKHLAIASMTEGELFNKNDAKITAYLATGKSYHTRFILSPMILFVILRIISDFA
ncbi:hypothetical protein [Shewanella sp. SR44-3]|uniref:hypothetical protein n=1 Tax=Shewanella sp. SR44-3 TaxID=2760936 RepID=UPI0015FAF0D4|nr:hypothetical protein [Shewanella sp. SR44-3]MBB1268196.1 hypothetical protein [Shewanella sp. SR44-3]